MSEDIRSGQVTAVTFFYTDGTTTKIASVNNSVGFFHDLVDNGRERGWVGFGNLETHLIVLWEQIARIQLTLLEAAVAPTPAPVAAPSTPAPGPVPTP